MRRTSQLILGFVVAVLLTIPLDGIAQDSEFERFRQQREQAFQQFVSERDRQFSEFLRREWKQVDLDVTDPDTEEKLPEIPVFTPEERPSDKPAIEIEAAERSEEEVTPPPPPRAAPPPPPTPEARATPSPEPVLTPLPRRTVDPTASTITVNKFGHNHRVVTASHFSTQLPGRLNNNTIADHWLKLAGGDYSKAVEDLKDIITRHRWNDWAASMFVRAYADRHVSDESSRVALTWFLLSKIGYTVHVGYVNDRLVLIAPATTRVYAVPRYTMDGSRMYFYLMDGLNQNTRGIRSIHTYAADEVPRNSSLDLHFFQQPLGEPNIKSRDIRFAYIDRAITITLQYDQNMVDFLKTFPQTDLTVFFNAAASEVFDHSMRTQIAPLLEGKTQGEQLNILLRLVQTGFEYKTDTKQFNRQRFMTPDEILFYPYSDCDDRAILFAYLVRNLMGLDVIGLEYSGHVATAVRADPSLEGDRIIHNGQSYLVCDPTYIMADYGMSMPQFASERPKPIVIR